jgi:hypothetical protein
LREIAREEGNATEDPEDPEDIERPEDIFEVEYDEPPTVPYNSSGFHTSSSEIVRYFNNQSPPNKTVHRITAINAFTLTLIFL